MDKPNRYKPVEHKKLKLGDLVLLVENNCKRYNYPRGRVVNVDVNSLNEVTAAKIKKGDSGEIVYRHVNSLIRLLPAEDFTGNNGENSNEPLQVHKTEPVKAPNSRPKRRAAARCRENTRILVEEDCV